MENKKMSKYSPLWEHIKATQLERGVLSFDEIQSILGFPIDHSFLNFKKELESFGYIIGKISLKNKTVDYQKTNP